MLSLISEPRAKSVTKDCAFTETDVTVPVLHVVQARLAYVAAEGELKQPFKDELPTRQAQLSTLQDTEEFDVLVVGGGATGSGCALDAVTRSESP